ncbi:MAG: FAD-dependent oxidoreductase [archaeon]
MRCSARVLNNVQLTPTVWRLTILLDEDITCKPGQYMSFEFEENGSIFRRPYSVLAQLDMRQLEFLVKRKGKFSSLLCDVRASQKLTILGPFGKFLLEPAQQMIFIATSTGLSPLFCMLSTRPAGKSWLFFGARTEEELLLHDQLSQLDITYLPILSRSPQWRGEQGHVQDALARHWSAVADGVFYICGGKGMVDDVRAFLEGKGVPEERIKFEEYT